MITLRDIYAQRGVRAGQRFMGIGPYTSAHTIEVLERNHLKYEGGSRVVRELENMDQQIMAEFVMVRGN